ncbi:metacaspase [Russula emetica]|nr:metacaspase [Russula emetica]
MYLQALQSSSLQPRTPAGYDTAAHASQQSPMGQRPPTVFVRISSVQSADSRYPGGFVRQQSPGQMTLALPLSQGSAGAWNPLAGPFPNQSTSKSHSPYNPGGFRVVCLQNPRPIAGAPPSQGPARVQNAWVPVSQVCLNRTIMAAKKRKALFIGINYSQHPDREFKLRHCTRDAYEMANFLRTYLDFAPCDIRVMTDEMENPWDRPTKENILLAMQELVRDAQPGDSFFLYFSGHGVQIEDTDGDELDGLDECICAVDYCGDDPDPTANTPGLIVDDDMHDILVRPLPPQCRLTALFDSCHSGTALDLPYEYDSNGVVEPFRHPEWLRVLRQKASYADVVSLSASNDNQRAQETDRGGALRCAFIDSMKMFNNTLSHKELIRSVLEHMDKYGIPQQPQLSTSHEIDTDLPFIV